MSFSLYFVKVRSRRGDVYWTERLPKDMDRATTISDVATGQFGQIIQILECRIGGQCRDVTRDLLKAADALVEAEPQPDHQAIRNDHRRDLAKHGEPA